MKQYFLPGIFAAFAILLTIAAIDWYNDGKTGHAVVVPKVVAPQDVASSAQLPTAASLPAASFPPGTKLSGLRDNYPDNQLFEIFNAIKQEKLDDALSLTDQLIAKYPNYRLAYLIRGDLLVARTRPLDQFGGGATASNLEDLRAEALTRLHAYSDRPPTQLFPEYLLQLASNQQYAIVVDTLKSRLYLFQNKNGQLQLAADYYVTQGKLGAGKSVEGDKRTPIGVYHIVQSLPKNTLGPLYGDGAFPLNYPNEWDKRLNRGGKGIWLHGTPADTFARAPKASDGCVVVTNTDLNEISPMLQMGLTPVIVSYGVTWVKPEKIAEERQDFLAVIEAWRKDWESKDTDRYLSHYSTTFKSADENFEQFASHKRQVNGSRQWIKVAINQLSFFKTPPESGKDVMVVEFEQDYRSDALNNKMRKRQYWHLEDGSWKIIYEGAA